MPRCRSTARVIRATGAAHIGDAVRYVARDRPDHAGAPRPEMWVHGFDCPVESRSDRETAIDIMRAQMAASGRRPKPYHVVLTWQAGEHPTRAQAAQAAEHVLDRLGFGDCPAVAAFHKDTDNDHLHLVVCRVDESGHIHAVPHRDHLILDRAMRELEMAQGWARANGPWVTVDTQNGPQIVRMSRTERLVAVLGECLDRDDVPVDKTDGNQELLRSPVISPRLHGDRSADRVRLTHLAPADPLGGCAHLDAVLYHRRATAIRPHGRHGLANHDKLVAATHGVRPRMCGGNETQNSEDRYCSTSHNDIARARVGGVGSLF